MAKSNKEHQRAYREAHREECNQRSRDWRARNPEIDKEAKRRWRERNPDKVAEYQRKVDAKQYAEDPRRRRARTAVNHAISRGKIQRGMCEICGRTEHIEAHHDDYSKPLEVRWLCRKHHREHHRLEKAA